MKVCGDRKFFCSMELTLQVIGGKWKPFIVHRLGTNGTMRFSELKRSIPKITQKMLTQQLRELEGDGLIYREVYPQVPPKVEYSLTDLGTSVMPVIKILTEWGNDYIQWYEENSVSEKAV